MKKLMVALASVVFGFAVTGYAMASAKSADEEIKARIAPIGEVCEQGQSCGSAAPAQASAGSSGKSRSGKEIFEQVCTACHTPGALGAPKFGNKADWAPRIAKGMDTLYQHALNGFNAMPPHGTCTNCSEQEIKDAVDYMTSHSK